ncbi:MAG: tetratricopeptide repeat protein, partial [Deltaproteobacteria bacterium]|nr:tetratricopeptide repeat protein [Deltaproteobacteria bacterium]
HTSSGRPSDQSTSPLVEVGAGAGGHRNRNGITVRDAQSDITKNNQNDQSNIKLHIGIAEQGKLYALAGDHQKALFYYRHAIRMTVEAKDPEVFFRHYLDCVMESLEQLGSYEEVLEYCNKAIQFYNDNPPPNPLAQWDLAGIHQRKGVILLKMGDKEAVPEPFRKALDIARELNQKLPLTETLLRWVEAQMHIDPGRVKTEQERTQYFTVRKETVDPARAVKLPNENMPGI